MLAAAPGKDKGKRVGTVKGRRRRSGLARCASVSCIALVVACSSTASRNARSSAVVSSVQPTVVTTESEVPAATTDQTTIAVEGDAGVPGGDFKDFDDSVDKSVKARGKPTTVGNAKSAFHRPIATPKALGDPSWVGVPPAPVEAAVMVFNLTPAVGSVVVVTYSYPYLSASEVPSEEAYAAGLRQQVEQILRDSPRAAVKLITLPSTNQAAFVGWDPERLSLGVDFRGAQGAAGLGNH